MSGGDFPPCLALLIYVFMLFILNACFLLLYFQLRDKWVFSKYLPSTYSVGIAHSGLPHQERECDLVMRYVPGFGIGLYAGKLFEPDSDIEHTIGLDAIKDPMDQTELADYYFNFNDTHYLVTMGQGLYINHMSESDGTMVRKVHLDPDDETRSTFQAVYTIFPGDQLFITYGDAWFDYRNITAFSPRKLLDRNVTHVENVQHAPGRLPGCRQGLTFMDEDGVVRARQNIYMGEYIEIARALRIPELLLDQAPTLRKVGWYKPRVLCQQAGLCEANRTSAALADGGEIVDPDAEEISEISETSIEGSEEEFEYSYEYIEPDYALLLLGGGSFYSGMTRDKSNTPNVFYDWYDLAYLNTAEHSIYTVPEHTDSESSLPSGCSNRMFVAFVAARDIAEGEELVLPLSPGSSDLTGESDDRRYTTAEFASQCM